MHDTYVANLQSWQNGYISSRFYTESSGNEWLRMLVQKLVVYLSVKIAWSYGH